MVMRVAPVGDASKSQTVLPPVVHRISAGHGNIGSLVRVFVILDDRTSLEHPLGETPKSNPSRGHVVRSKRRLSDACLHRPSRSRESAPV